MEYRTPSVALAFKSHFPLLQNKSLIYVDNAASTPPPTEVIKAMEQVMTEAYSNVKRSTCLMAQEVTEQYEMARFTVANSLHVPSNTIAFTANATTALNVIIHGLAATLFSTPGKVILSPTDHHAAIVPWFMARDIYPIEILWAPLTKDGDIDLDALRIMLKDNVRVLSVPHMSNVLGTLAPIKQIMREAHAYGVLCVVDGAQGFAEEPLTTDLTDWDVDFYAFTGHKMFGPTGIGVMYGKESLLKNLPPFVGGGEMIDTVSLTGVSFAIPPDRFEAGTPPIVQATGLKAALEFIQQYETQELLNHKKKLATYLRAQLKELDHIHLMIQPPNVGSIVSFWPEKIHPYDLSSFLGQSGICLREGKFCAHPLFQVLQLPQGCMRISLAPYNTVEDIDRVVSKIKKGISLLW